MLRMFERLVNDLTLFLKTGRGNFNFVRFPLLIPYSRIFSLSIPFLAQLFVSSLLPQHYLI